MAGHALHRSERPRVTHSASILGMLRKTAALDNYELFVDLAAFFTQQIKAFLVHHV